MRRVKPAVSDGLKRHLLFQTDWSIHRFLGPFARRIFDLLTVKKPHLRPDEFCFLSLRPDEFSFLSAAIFADVDNGMIPEWFAIRDIFAGCIRRQKDGSDTVRAQSRPSRTPRPPSFPRPPLLHSHRSAAEEPRGVAGAPSTRRVY